MKLILLSKAIRVKSLLRPSSAVASGWGSFGKAWTNVGPVVVRGFFTTGAATNSSNSLAII